MTHVPDPIAANSCARAGGGFGMIALAALLAEDGLLAEEPCSRLGPAIRWRPKRRTIQPRAQRVIFLFMSGGPSHLETFDPKPDLQRLHGQPLPDSFGPVMTRRGVEKQPPAGDPAHLPASTGSPASRSPTCCRTSATCVDDLCVLRGCHGDSVTHPESVYQMNTGSILMGRPSLGAGSAYGLGTENQNLPAFVVLPDPGGWVKGGRAGLGQRLPAGRLPGHRSCAAGRRRSCTCSRRRTSAPPSSAARSTSSIASTGAPPRPRRTTASWPPASPPTSWPSACRRARPRSSTWRGETEATRRLYGLDRTETAEFGLRCLLARRLVERGVRFVQLYCGDTNGWDAHADVEGNHARLCAPERPARSPACCTDLKRRGLLDDTLVIWGGEFGRTPMTEGATGRDHNPHGFTMWLAGGGVKGGQVIGATDEVGLRAVEDNASTSTTCTPPSCTCSASTTHA